MPRLIRILDLVELCFGYNRADLAAFDVRRSNLSFFSYGSGGFNGLVVDRALHEHPGRRVAGLARIVEAVPHAARDGLFIRIGEDDVGPLAPQFEADALHGLRCRLADRHTSAGRPGEADHVHVRVRGEMLRQHRHHHRSQD